MKNYITVIGLEVHAELKTKTKAFCSCSTEFGSTPNTHVCPVCLGMPGALPVLNKQVVEFAIRTALHWAAKFRNSINLTVKTILPRPCQNYQISQFDQPVCLGGHIDIEVDGVPKRLGITRIHMEEDAGKLNHSGATISTSDFSSVDYNRAGVPLLEIVSEPDMRSAEEARAYMEQLKAVLEYIDVCDCKMQEGSLRCDANISIMPEGAKEFGTRAEIKNLNSFRALVRAIEYEVERQKAILEDGGHVVQETRTWDEANGVTLSMRSKEEAHDYRYFPEPDLVPVEIDDAWIERVRGELPELPAQRLQRLVEKHGLPKYDASLIVATKAMADYFDAACANSKDDKGVSNWLLGDVSAYLNAENITIEQFPVKPENLGELVTLTKDGVLSSKLAKSICRNAEKQRQNPETAC